MILDRPRLPRVLARLVAALALRLFASPAQAIHNGTPTDSLMYRAVGRLTSVGMYPTTATLIARNVILAAAQSLVNAPDNALIGAYDTPGSARGVALAGSRAYGADGGAGLQILDASNPASPVLLGSDDTPGAAEAVVVVDTVAYVADGTMGLRIVSVADPATPRWLGTHHTPDYATDVAVVGTREYVADGGPQDC